MVILCGALQEEGDIRSYCDYYGFDSSSNSIYRLSINTAECTKKIEIEILITMTSASVKQQLI